jgi:hypothetical protein
MLECARSLRVRDTRRGGEAEDHGVSRLARHSNAVASWLLIFAVATVVPPVRWCPLVWDQVRPGMLAECAALGPVDLETPAAWCPETPHRMAAAAAVRGDDSGCDRCAAGCGAARGCAPGAPTCGAAHGREWHGAAGSTAPRRDRARAFCLGEPGSGRALRARAPQVAAPHEAFGILPVLALPAPAPPARVERESADARPPTRSPAARPPIRGPPSTI